MNLFREQVPYVHRPPKYSSWFKPVLNLACSYILKNKFKVQEVRIRGAEAVANLAKEGHSVLVAPNHADHADPSLLITAARRAGVTFHFMAAREGFEKGAFQRFFLQKSGAFSVNREGGDVGAIKTAIRILQEGRFPLVIFPEGEIYHHHEILDELNDGVASILLRASSKLPDGQKSYVVPTAIRIHHAEEVEAGFSDRLDHLEQSITWKPRPDLDPVQRIYRLGSALLAIKEEEFLGHSNQGSLVDRIQGLQHRLLSEMEGLHDLQGETSPMPTRIKTLRGKIRAELTNEASPVEETRKEELYDQLDRIFIAQQFYSYPGRYLKENPTHDRIAETIFKLEEDVLQVDLYHGPRTADVVFDEPVEIASFLEERSLNFKSGVSDLTQLIREKVQTLLLSLD